MNTYIIWEAETGDYESTDDHVEASTEQEAIKTWLFKPGQSKTRVELRLSCPKDGYRQWSINAIKNTDTDVWGYHLREMTPVAWYVGCVLDQTLGLLNTEGTFGISHKDAVLFNTEEAARQAAVEERALERSYRVECGYRHAAEDLDVFEDPIPVFEVDEFRRRPDTW